MGSDFLALAKPYWVSEDRWKARGWLLLILALTLANIIALVRFNLIVTHIFNGLQEFPMGDLSRTVIAFAIWSCGYVVLTSLQVYAIRSLGLRWQSWLTAHLHAKWMADQDYYRQLARQGTDNLEQRLPEDVGSFIDNTLGLLIGLVHQVFAFCAFLAILWYLSGAIRFTADIGGIFAIYGLMVWACLLYVLTGALITARTSLFVGAFRQIALWRAAIRRLAEFLHTVETARLLGQAQDTIVLAVPSSKELHIQGLSLTLPDGTPLLDAIDLKLKVGQTLLISGPTGRCKNMLLRTIMDIWSYTRGRATLPGEYEAMALPQKPYLPSGSLRAALAYPAFPDTFPDADLKAVLERCRLSSLIENLDEEGNWLQRLSLGEQQSLAFCRILLHRPDWLLLDEATSALDENTEAALYHALYKALPNVTLLSIGNRSSLYPLHEAQGQNAQDLPASLSPAGAPLITLPVSERSADATRIGFALHG